MGKKIEKKLLPQYYREVVKRRKTFELRKDEDDVQVGDILTLREWDGEAYTGHKITREVTYVLRDCPEYGLADGYCIIGMMPIGWNDEYYAPAIVKPTVPESFWKLASAGSAKSKASWAFTQTSEYDRKKTIINVDADEALTIFWALQDYIEKHRKEYADA